MAIECTKCGAIYKSVEDMKVIIHHDHVVAYERNSFSTYYRCVKCSITLASLNSNTGKYSYYPDAQPYLIGSEE